MRRAWRRVELISKAYLEIQSDGSKFESVLVVRSSMTTFTGRQGRSVTALFVASLSLLIASSSPGQTAAEDALSLAASAHREGNHRRELKILTKAAKATDNPKVLFWLAEARLENGLTRKSAFAAEAAWKLSSDSVLRADAASLVGRILFFSAQQDGGEKGTYEKARRGYARAAEWFRASTNDAPENGTAWFFLGLALSAANDHSGAVTAMRQALQNNVDSSCGTRAKALITSWEELLTANGGNLDQHFVPPEALERTQPRYTENARQAGFSGAVTTLVLLNQSGAVEFVCSFNQLPYGLTEQTEQALRRWVYAPPIGSPSGRPIPFSFIVTTEFSVTR